MGKKALLLICLLMLCGGCGNKAETPAEGSTGTEAEAEAETETKAETETETEAAGEAEASETAADLDGNDNAAVEESAQEESPDPFEEKADVESGEDDLSQRDLFADFIMGKGEAVVSKDFLSAVNMTELTVKPGDRFTVSELESLLQKDSMIGYTNPEVSYSPLSIHDGALYAMRLYYETDIENITETMVFSDHSGKLEMIFAIDSWSRRYAEVNQHGVIRDSGSNGAGSHSSVTYVPDKSFIYRIVSDLDEEYYGFHFYDEEGDPTATVNAIMDEAGEGNEKAADVVYYREIINGRRFYYFLRGNEKLTQDTVEYIDKVAKAHNFTFDGKNAADEARAAYEKELGAEEACKDDTEPHWKTL